MIGRIFKERFLLPSDWTAKHDYAKAIFMGFPAGTAAGAAVWIDASSKDAVYLAEEKLTIYRFRQKRVQIK